jgi:hypothetical protein
MLQLPDWIVNEQVPVVSLQLSVVQGIASLHVEPVAQVPSESQVPQPSMLPSLQRAPIRGVHSDWLTLGSHDSQEFAGLSAPDARQVPAMAQVSGFGVEVQTPVRSVQRSVVHESPSVQVLAVEHTPAALQVPQPAAEPSSQRAPVRGLHALGAVAGLQLSQGFVGFCAPLA